MTGKPCGACISEPSDTANESAGQKYASPNYHFEKKIFF